MPLETWYNVAQAVGVALVAITFAAAALTFVIGYFVNKKKDEQIRQHAERIAEANAGAARANEGVATANLEIEKSKEETAKANATAKTAEATAALANERAENLTQENLQIRARLEETNLDVLIQQKRVGELQIEVADARRQQAEAERALAEVRKKIAPRILTEMFTSVLREMPKNPPVIPTVTILFPRDDPEAYGFAESIRRALLNVRWLVEDSPRPLKQGIGEELRQYIDPVTDTARGGGIYIVARIRVGTSPIISPALSTLLDAFRASGFEPQLIPSTNLSVNFVIVIGPKPL